MKGQRLQEVDKFTYLGSTLSRVMHIDDEVNARIAKASAAFGRLRDSVWDRSGIGLDTINGKKIDFGNKEHTTDKKIGVSVLLRLFISSNEVCNTAYAL